MLKPMVLWGATGQAKVLREFVGGLGYRVVAVFDSDVSVTPPFADLPLYRGREAFLSWRRENAEPCWCLVAIGGERGHDRVEIQRYLSDHGLTPATVVHPSATVASDAEIGVGGQILANATVGAQAKVGEACILNTGSSVDHECVLGSGVHVAPGAVLTGLVRVGNYGFIGANAVVLPRVAIGERAVVGAGAVVIRDVPPGMVVYGNPARPRRSRKEARRG